MTNKGEKVVVEVSLDGIWRFKGYKGCNGEELGAHTTECDIEVGYLLKLP